MSYDRAFNEEVQNIPKTLSETLSQMNSFEQLHHHKTSTKEDQVGLVGYQPGLITGSLQCKLIDLSV